MISGVTGEVAAIGLTDLHLQTPFVTLRVACPIGVLATTSVGQTLSLQTFLKVAETELSLYGFAETSDVELFRLLLSVSGIGPKSALEFISAGSDAVRIALVSEDLGFLTSVKGIGKKTANRAILELKNKVDPPVASGKSIAAGKGNIAGEATDALLGLGFTHSEIVTHLPALTAEAESAEEVIRKFLALRASF